MSLARDHRAAPSAAATEPQSELNVLCLLPLLDWSLGDIRIKNPLERWQMQSGGGLRRRLVAEFVIEDIVWADVVVFQREADPRILGLIQDLKRLGKKVVFDIDDLLTAVPEFLSSYEHCARVRPHLEAVLAEVDAITVTTPRLQSAMRRYNEQVMVVANGSDASGRTVSHGEGEAPIRLLLASSDTVRVDAVVAPLQRIAAEFPDTLEILAVGPPAKMLEDAGLPVRPLAMMPYHEFGAFLATLDNAVGLIPLDDSEFSGCKSPIKFIDYSLAGIPCICSAVPPYSDVAEHGKTALLLESSEEAWYQGIRSLVASAAERRRLADNASALCREKFSLDESASAWQRVFSSVTAPSPDAIPVPTPQQQYAQMLWRHRLRSLLSLSGRLFRASAYRSAYQVWRAEGLAGIRQRLAQII